jgi:hypothetical protein
MSAHPGLDWHAVTRAQEDRNRRLLRARDAMDRILQPKAWQDKKG